jgi:hypothetical protein
VPVHQSRREGVPGLGRSRPEPLLPARRLPARRAGIDVPLLEDESSIVLVLSETLRAVAQGTIALKSGSLLLEGCRLAHTMQMERVRAANLERSRRRTAVREEEIGEEGQETEAGSRKQEAGSSEAEATGHRAPGTGRRTPDSAPGSPHRFPDPGKNWDEERSNVESETTDRFDPRYEETREGVLAAQAEPLDERMEEELAVGVR